MTEAEWNACTDPQPMLEFLRGKASDRKLRLFAVACCRRVQHLLMTDAGRLAVDVAERNADGLASEQEVENLSLLLKDEGLAESWSGDIVTWSFDRRAEAIAEAVWYSTEKPQDESAWGCSNVQHAVDRCLPRTFNEPSEGRLTEQTAQATLLRCIFGPIPFRSVTLDRSCLTSTVTSLAQAIYADRAFDRLPILADALEDAGCTNAEILSHCRSPGPHVLGCWVVDLLLGRE